MLRGLGLTIRASTSTKASSYMAASRRGVTHKASSTRQKPSSTPVQTTFSVPSSSWRVTSSELAAALNKDVEILSHVEEVGLIALCKPCRLLSHPNSSQDIDRSMIRLPYNPVGEFFFFPDSPNPSKQAFSPTNLQPDGVAQPLPDIYLEGANAHASISSSNNSTCLQDGKSSLRKIWLLNRLDIGTSGLILCCTQQSTKDKVQAIFSNRLAKKEYIAKVFGLFKGSQDWEDYIQFNRSNPNEVISQTFPLVTSSKTKKNIVVGNNNCKIAETAVDVFEQRRFALSGVGRTSKITPNVNPNPASSASSGRKVDPPPFMSLLRLRPSTGFTHQLRAQCLSHGLPIVGDQKYGDSRQNKKYLDYLDALANILTKEHADVISSPPCTSTAHARDDSNQAITQPPSKEGKTVFRTSGAMPTSRTSTSSSFKPNPSSSNPSRRRTYLHSHSISFLLPLDDGRKSLHFQAKAPIPDDFFTEFII